MSKTVLITGASSGIGRTIAEYLAQKGYQVIGTSRNGNVIANYDMIALDINNEQSVNMAIQTCLERYQKIDILINNAGFGICGAIEDTSIEEAKQQFETNFFGAVRMIKAVLPHMRERKQGLIINISSIGGLIGLPFQGFYSSSKFALEGLMEALRLEIKPFNISALNINPGDFKTGFTSNRRKTKVTSIHYQTALDTTLSIYERDEQNAPEPYEIGVLIEKLIKKGNNYKVRYLVGQLPQKMSITIKNLLGSKLFEKIIASTYKI